MVLRKAFPLLLVVGAVLVSAPASGQTSVESQIFSQINGSRSSPFIWHSGLASVARSHSMDMARRGGLNHNNADSRISSAPADPPEGGGRDSGFQTAGWCENVAYAPGGSGSEAAQRLYASWQNSSPHRRCMQDSGKNVGAVGIFHDGSTWWATFIAHIDRTPPGNAAARPAPTQAPTAPPPATAAPREPAAATAPEAATPRDESRLPASTPAGRTSSPTRTSLLPEPTPDEPSVEPADEGIIEDAPETPDDPRIRVVALAADEPAPVRSLHENYGWPEIGALAGLLVIAALLTRRITPRAGGSGTS